MPNTAVFLPAIYIQPELPNTERYRNRDLDALLEELSRTSTGTTSGRDRIELLQSMITARAAEMLAKQLMGTAQSIGHSANALKDTLNHSTELAKESLENAAEFLIAALKVNTDTGSKNAAEIRSEISGLTSNLRTASGEIQKAGNQNSRLSRRLNWLTAALVFAALITAGASGFQALGGHLKTGHTWALSGVHVWPVLGVRRGSEKFSGQPKD